MSRPADRERTMRRMGTILRTGYGASARDSAAGYWLKASKPVRRIGGSKHLILTDELKKAGYADGEDVTVMILRKGSEGGHRLKASKPVRRIGGSRALILTNELKEAGYGDGDDVTVMILRKRYGQDGEAIPITTEDDRMCICEICPMMDGDEWPDCKKCPYADGTEGDERMDRIATFSNNAGTITTGTGVGRLREADDTLTTTMRLQCSDDYRRVSVTLTPAKARGLIELLEAYIRFKEGERMRTHYLYDIERILGTFEVIKEYEGKNATDIAKLMGCQEIIGRINEFKVKGLVITYILDIYLTPKG